MFIFVTKSSATDKVAEGKIKFRTMRETIEAIENYGEELPPAADVSQFMFENSKDVDMDAYCDPNVDIQKFGASIDEHTYFGEVCERIGVSKHSDIDNQSD